MNLKPLMIVIAVAAVAACSDKDEAGGEPGDTSMLEKASQMSGELGSAIKEKAAATGESVSAAADKAGQAVSESVRSAGETGSEWVSSAVEATRSLTGSATATTPPAEAQLAAPAQQAQAELESAVPPSEAPISTAESDAAVAAAAPAAAPAVGFASLEPASAGLELDSAQMAAGKTVYTEKCMACHATGAAGAPRLGDAANWEPRIEQGAETLADHAINGYRGSQGYMPAKGGFGELSDVEVKAAVAYMVSQSQ